MTKRKHNRHQLYRYYDSDGYLLYVGISLSAVSRLSQHKASASWYELVSDIQIDNYPSREALEAAEKEVIRHEHPMFNKQHSVPIKIDREDLMRFSGKGFTKESVDFLNKKYAREGHMSFSLGDDGALRIDASPLAFTHLNHLLTAKGIKRCS